MTKLNETKTEFSARVGLTKGRISQLIAEGLPVRSDDRIDVDAGLAWMENNLDPAKRNKGGTAAHSGKTNGAAPVSGGALTMSEARRLYMVTQVQRARLAYDKERGKLIDAGDAERTVFARAKGERDAHIAWVQRSAPVMAAELGLETGPVFAVLDRLMREHLEHLASTPLGWLFNADSE